MARFKREICETPIREFLFNRIYYNSDRLFQIIIDIHSGMRGHLRGRSLCYVIQKQDSFIQGELIKLNLAYYDLNNNRCELLRDSFILASPLVLFPYQLVINERPQNYSYFERYKLDPYPHFYCRYESEESFYFHSGIFHEDYTKQYGRIETNSRFEDRPLDELFNSDRTILQPGKTSFYTPSPNDMDSSSGYKITPIVQFRNITDSITSIIEIDKESEVKESIDIDSQIKLNREYIKEVTRNSFDVEGVSFEEFCKIRYELSLKHCILEGLINQLIELKPFVMEYYNKFYDRLIPFQAIRDYLDNPDFLAKYQEASEQKQIKDKALTIKKTYSLGFYDLLRSGKIRDIDDSSSLWEYRSIIDHEREIESRNSEIFYFNDYKSKAQCIINNYPKGYERYLYLHPGHLIPYEECSTKEDYRSIFYKEQDFKQLENLSGDVTYKDSPEFIRIKSSYQYAVDQLLELRDGYNHYLFLGFPSPSAFGNDVQMKFVFGTDDKYLDRKYDIHNYHFRIIDIEILTNKELREIIYRRLFNYFFTNDK